MLDATEELRRQLAARGYEAAAIVAVPTGGAPTAVYRVVVRDGPGSWSRGYQGTVVELRHRITQLPRTAAARAKRRPGASKSAGPPKTR